MFVVGMLLAPLASRPFLSDNTASSEDVSEVDNITLEIQTFRADVPGNISKVKEADLTYPYLTAGLCMILSGVVFVFVMIYTEGCHPQRFFLLRKDKQPEKTQGDEKLQTDKSVRRQKLILTTLVSCFIFAFCIAESLYGTFLVSFTVETIVWSASDAAGLASVFFFVLIGARIAGIFIIIKVKPVFMILCGMSMTIVSCVLFYLVKEHWSLIWVASCLAAAGSSTQYPSTLSWVSEYTEVKGFVGTALLSSSALGFFVGPLSFGLLYKFYQISAFLYVLSASLCLKLTMYTAINIFLKMHWKNEDKCENDIRGGMPISAPETA